MIDKYESVSRGGSLDLSINTIPEHVLVVDDDRETLELLSIHLKNQVNRVTTVNSGSKALKLVRKDSPDLILLDLMMPQLDGFQVCKALRANYQMPIIVISALGEEEEIVRALDLGADDYLIKPYNTQELLERIRAVMRRRSGHKSRRQISIEVGGFIADLNSGDISNDGESIRLTPTEFNLLTELLLHPDECLRHDLLLTRVWGSAYTKNVEYLHMYISRLRKKLDGISEFKILTCPGTGYKLKIDAD